MALDIDVTLKRLSVWGKGLNAADALSYVYDERLAEIVQAARTGARNDFIAYVNNDTKLAALTLPLAWDEFVRQMISQAKTINAPTYTQTAPVVDYTANTFGLDVYYKDKYDTTTYPFRPFQWELKCVAAPLAGYNYTSQWVFFGSEYRSPLIENWYSGLGFSTSLKLITGQVDGSAHLPNTNMLVNGGMERFTANVPDNWIAAVGTAGTHFNAVTTPYIGTNALRFIGDGATLTKLYQTIGDATGTPIVIQPRTHYVIQMYRRRYATGAITGVFRASVQSSGGTILYGTNAFVSLDVATATTTYTSSSFRFYSGDTPPTTARLVLEFTTALGNTHEFFVDEVKMAPCIPVPGLGHVFFTEGSVAASVDDRLVYDYAISADGAFYKMLERLFDLTPMGIHPPADAAAGETTADANNISCP